MIHGLAESLIEEKLRRHFLNSEAIRQALACRKRCTHAPASDPCRLAKRSSSFRRVFAFRLYPMASISGAIACCRLSGWERPLIAAVSARRLPKLPLECSIKGSLRFVSDVGGNLRDASRGPLKRSSGHLKAPTS